MIVFGMPLLCRVFGPALALTFVSCDVLFCVVLWCGVLWWVVCRCRFDDDALGSAFVSEFGVALAAAPARRSARNDRTEPCRRSVQPHLDVGPVTPLYSTPFTLCI